MLPLPDTDGYSTCMSCGRNHRIKERPEPVTEPTPAPGPGEPFATWTPDITVTVARTPKVSTGSGKGCVLGVFLLIGAIVAGVVVMVSSVSKSVKDTMDRALTVDNSRLTLTGRVVAIDPTGSGGHQTDGAARSAEVVAVAYDSGSNSRLAVRLELVGSAERPDPKWTTDAFPESVYDAPLAQLGDRLMMAVGDDLKAVNLQTGATVWTAALPDKVTPGCETCFVVLGDTLVVHTVDDQVLGFGAGSPEPRWTRRLASAASDVLVSAAGVVISDEDPAKPGQQMVTVLDPVSGAQRSALVPSCVPDQSGFPRTMNFADHLAVIPGGPDLVAMVSSIETCLVRWDGSTGQIKWTVQVSDGGSLDGDDMLVTADRLIAPTTDGALASVNLADGAANRLVTPTDLAVVPVGVSADVLLAETTTTRGTTRGGLAAWNLSSGQPLWQTSMPDGAKPFSDRSSTSDALFSGSPLARLEFTAAGADLVTFNGDDYSVSLQKVDLATGTLGEARRWVIGEGPGTLSVGVGALSPHGLLVSAQSSVLALPVGTDGGLLSWPGPGS